MTRIFLLYIFVSIHLVSFSQNRESTSENIIKLTVIGEGKTNQESLADGLSKAFIQTFKVFISNNTKEIELIRNEAISSSIGIIQKFDIIAEKDFGDGTYVGTYMVVISIDKLKTYCESKGMKIEFQVGLFTKKVKQQVLLEQSEIEAVWNTLFILNPIMNKSFDYKYQTFDPVSIDGNNKFKVRLIVDCIGNQNQEFVFDYLKNFLKGVSMNESEQLQYQETNKQIWGIKIDGEKYFLRNEKSFYAFQSFFNEILYIERRFVIEDNIKNLLGSNANYEFGKRNNQELEVNSVKGAHHDLNETIWLQEPDSYDAKHTDNYSGFEDLGDCNLTLSTGGSIAPGFFVYSLNKGQKKVGLAYKKRDTGKVIKTYDFSITYTLVELEKIQRIQIHHVSKDNKIGQWYKGGVIFFEDSTIYLLHPIDFKQYTFGSYQNCCDTMSGNPNNKCPDILMCNLNEYKLKDELQGVFFKTVTDTLIGSGMLNTKKLSSITNQYNNPFKYIINLELNGFNGWYVPSKIETELLITYSEKYYAKFLPSIFTSSLKKGKEYNIYWDSFYVPSKDNDNNKVDEFHLPFKKGAHDELFFGNAKIFIPIRIENHR